jgi:ElaA protein
MLDVNVKSFEELTPQELYSVLQLRSEIFVVEQNCVYQDMDDKDQKALHLLGMKNGNLVAYTRIFKPGDYFEFASIGRVLVSQNQRQHKYGYDIMNASIETVKEYFNTTEIKIGAQCYLKKFYNNLGFKEVGEGYLEDGIPHIHMIRTP